MIRCEPRILVATDTLADGELVADLLRDDFGSVFISTAEARIAADFDQHRPDVLVLAFKELERAERYYLGLYRHSPIVHTHSHRTLVLCSQDDVRRAYALCRKGYFDDYVLFWPMVHDPHRLSMSVLLARRALEAGRAAAPKTRLAVDARPDGECELPPGQGIVDPPEIGPSPQRPAAPATGEVIENFAEPLRDPSLDGTVEGRDIRFAQTAPRVREGGKPTTPAHESSVDRNRKPAPDPESPKTLKSRVEKLRPLVLVVDDDEFQCSLLAKLLASARYELAFAHSASVVLRS